MSYTDPKQLSTSLAGLMASFFALVYVILSIITDSFNIVILVITGILLFTFAFLLLRYAITKFIYNKIKVIYKTIHNIRVRKDEDEGYLLDESLDDVNRQVVEWGEKQKNEIDTLKEQATYRREFLGNVSHELKTPIFNIQGYVLTLLDGGINDPNINKDYLIRTEKSINRMIAIVEDLETISQLESATLNLDLTTFDIVSLTREIIEFMEIKAKKKKVVLDFDKSYDRPIMVEADKKRIRQVLINLFDNAIKYCSKDDCYTRISFFDMDENVLVEVSDNGLGIDKENIPRIFERFFRTDKGRSREQGGTGLGLAIVKHILEAHQQAINVRSTKGVGTTFGFTLKKV
jgi:two-component system phosphate regulon sensor histidine kinase PhoR